jgi:hypothetical protein
MIKAVINKQIEGFANLATKTNHRATSANKRAASMRGKVGKER